MIQSQSKKKKKKKKGYRETFQGLTLKLCIQFTKKKKKTVRGSC